MSDTRPELTKADWLKRGDLARLVAALDPGGGHCRYVGGAVRDSLRGVTVNDIDMATTLLPQQVMDRLKAADIKVIPTGIDHGTVTAVLPDGPVEITTLRRDVSTDGRRATVAFSDDWREDAARRDFTINALYLDPVSHELFDYFGGEDDLATGKVRFIGSAEQRICEDYLRILRYFRFNSRFGQGHQDAEAIAACTKYAGRLASLSKERVTSEILSLLALADPAATVDSMFGCNIWSQIIPAVDADQIGQMKRLVARETNYALPRNALTRLYSLTNGHDVSGLIIGSHLRLSNAQKTFLRKLASAPQPHAANIREIAYRQGKDIALQKLLSDAEDGKLVPALKLLKGWEAPVLAVSGKDLITRGVPKGPDVSKLLSFVEDRWISEGFPAPSRQHEICKEVAEAR